LRLGADWCVLAWHFGPSGTPNLVDGDYYITDLEDPDDVDAFGLVRRFYSDDNDEILTIAEGSAEAMVATVRAILK